MYHCENGHHIEVLRRMSDPPLSACTVCGAPVQRVFSPPAIHFKGSGFYNTDYGRRGQKPGENGKADGASGEGAKSGDGAKSGEGATSSDKKSGGDGAAAKSSNGGSGSSKPAPAKSSE